MPTTLSRNIIRLRLAVLTFLHFLVDFYVGVRIPLIEPTLTEHLGVTIGAVMLIIGMGTLMVHGTQPLYGAIFPRGGSPWILAACPIIAAIVCMMGLVDSYSLMALLFGVSGLAIGVLHPEGMTLAYDFERESGV